MIQLQFASHAGSTPVSDRPSSRGFVMTDTKVLKKILQKLAHNRYTFGTSKLHELAEETTTYLVKMEYQKNASGIQEEDSKIAVLVNSFCDEAMWKLCGLLELYIHKNNYQ